MTSQVDGKLVITKVTSVLMEQSMRAMASLCLSHFVESPESPCSNKATLLSFISGCSIDRAQHIQLTKFPFYQTLNIFLLVLLLSLNVSSVDMTL